MDLGPLRALALELNLQTHGVPVTVTRPAPDDTPIETRGIWLTTDVADMPEGIQQLGHIPELQRRDPRRVMALSRAEVPTVPRTTRIVAPEKAGDSDKTWFVDSTDRIEADKTHVVVLPMDDES